MTNKKPVVIGIGGGSGSGKSTLCSILENALEDFKIKAIHNDDYFKRILPNIVAPYTGITYQDYNQPDSIDFDRLLKDFLCSLNESLDVVIIEGHMVLYSNEIREKLDLKVFVDCQSDERLVRRIKRYSEWGRSFDDSTSVYLDAVRYRHCEFVEPTRWYADVILNGSNLSEKGIDIILNWLKRQLGK